MSHLSVGIASSPSVAMNHQLPFDAATIPQNENVTASPDRIRSQYLKRGEKSARTCMQVNRIHSANWFEVGLLTRTDRPKPMRGKVFGFTSLDRYSR
jgi:hypothetical protein